MKFKLTKTTEDGKIQFAGEITQEDLLKIRLDPVERRLLDSDCLTSADYLLALEVLFRRFAEQNHASDLSKL